MMMGDAGSRALGLFLCICVFKTGNILLVIPLCFMLCLDGLLGIVKVSLIRFLKMKNAFKNIRTTFTTISERTRAGQTLR